MDSGSSVDSVEVKSDGVLKIMSAVGANLQIVASYVLPQATRVDSGIVRLGVEVDRHLESAKESQLSAAVSWPVFN